MAPRNLGIDMTSDNAPKLSIIVISYNTREMTLKCLETVVAETLNTEFQLIIIDNASTDGSAEAIDAQYGGTADVVLSERNLGFAAANNLAAEMAEGEYILLLNPDTEILDGAIDKLMAFSQENTEAKIWGGRTVFADFSLNPASSWGKMTLWGLAATVTGLSSLFRNSSIFNVEGMGNWDRKGNRHVDIVTGCFLLISREFWILLGGFDKEFFMYGEEADLCLRAAKLGANPLSTSAAVIVHHGGASETVQSDKLVRLLNAKYKLIEKHFPQNTRWLAKGLLTLWPWTRYISHSFLSAVGRAKSSLLAETWKDVWKRRKVWTNLSSA